MNWLTIISAGAAEAENKRTNAGEHNAVNNYSRTTRREHIGDQGIRSHGGTVFLASSPQSVLVVTGGGLMRP